MTDQPGDLELLESLEARGLHLRLRPDGTIAAGPKQLLGAEVSDLIRSRRADLIYALMLRREDTEPADNAITPAESLIATCRRLKIALRLDPDDRLVLGRDDLCGREPAIPLSLAMAVEVHAAAITELLNPNDIAATAAA